jgi:hypothetical protein
MTTVPPRRQTAIVKLVRSLTIIGCIALGMAVSGCGTPYKPPVMIRGSDHLDGLLTLATQQGTSKSLDVVMAHGMCRHRKDWAVESINGLMDLLSSKEPRQGAGTAATIIRGTEIEMIRAEFNGGGASFRVSALIWSPLTAKLKARLLYDRTGDRPTDCASARECKPERVKLNALIKDRLVGGCSAEVVIYQGASKGEIVRQVKIALSHDTAPSSSAASLLALDAQSATEQADKASGKAREAGIRTRQRNGLVFMRANQLALLSLADPERRVSDPLKSLSRESASARCAASPPAKAAKPAAPRRLAVAPAKGECRARTAASRAPPRGRP